VQKFSLPIRSPSTAATDPHPARLACKPFGCIGVCPNGGGCAASPLGGCVLLRQCDAAAWLFPTLDRDTAGLRLTNICRNPATAPPMLNIDLPKNDQKKFGKVRVLELHTFVAWVAMRLAPARATGRWPHRPMLMRPDLPGLSRKPPPPPMPTQLDLIRVLRGSIPRPHKSPYHRYNGEWAEE
jgi:hypothetical protein